MGKNIAMNKSREAAFLIFNFILSPFNFFGDIYDKRSVY